MFANRREEPRWERGSEESRMRKVGRVGGWVKKVKGIKKYKLPFIKLVMGLQSIAQGTY